jgi:putative ABC transport system ATP-binding protein
MELLSELNGNAGLTVLLVTHEPEMAAFARKIVHFKDGLVDQVENSRSSNDGSAPLNAFN